LIIADISRVDITNTNSQKSLQNLILCYSLMTKTELHTHTHKNTNLQ